MNIHFSGADREVTGSCHLLDTGKMKILIDCGMFQGGDFNEGLNHDSFPFDPKEIDVLLVTHAHLDHIGRIPKLVRDGYGGKIYATKGTKDLMPLIWYDAYNIMSYDNRKFGYPVLYDETDVAEAQALCHGLNYHEELDLGNGVKAVWKDAGHIFGSAFIEITVDGKKFAFSGDIGNENVPILQDTENLSLDVDYVICESTYGNRIHEGVVVRKSIISDLIINAVKRGGTIMVPAFSLERTQEFLYELNELSEYDHTLPKVPIFLDSPLAIDATKVYKKYPEYYDAEAQKLHLAGDDFLDFPQLQVTYSKRDSMKINHTPGPKMVIAGAGMMNGGRILHHALRYLSDPNSTLIIVGYQAYGTLGRKIFEGQKHVKVMGTDVDVRCEIKAIGALSAHGDQSKLLNWLGTCKKVKKIFCVHGEDDALTTFADKIKSELKKEAHIAKYDEVVKV
ncbi:MAG: MBL fold hydrolase [Candidatus Magasanikbacteria bacterium CG10_big_fil_rev_8_21_14_0_10_36_16]|uniref:MBL fold hydrolase n=1 Tax=Candidatus Magasanikbacteria bacterium CG10_big_fil_rev_8_21_14_0_10_36_16 TaxID=1974645 RepID=A0A2H0TYL2_9BACT|nr:MAG: MBL fold hydrolase [Candidatus Magasanikbacteria bacterium CG10_big_fil_rev_8_21_14_0_10_36_16]